jgi:hypothetical protein
MPESTISPQSGTKNLPTAMGSASKAVSGERVLNPSLHHPLPTSLSVSHVIVYFKGSLTRDFEFRLFLIFPEPLSSPLGPFRIFTKILGDIR